MSEKIEERMVAALKITMDYYIGNGWNRSQPTSELRRLVKVGADQVNYLQERAGGLADYDAADEFAKLPDAEKERLLDKLEIEKIFPQPNRR